MQETSTNIPSKTPEPVEFDSLLSKYKKDTWVKRGSEYLIYQAFIPSPDAERNTNHIGNWSVENKLIYAALHGYDYKKDGASEYKHDRPPAWQKVAGVQKYLPSYKWVCWFDVDTVITDIHRPLDQVVDPDVDLIVARTFEYFGLGEETKENEYRLNTGVYCIKNSTWSYKFLQEVWDLTQFIHHSNWEQRAMQVLLRDHPEYLPGHVKYVSQHDLNVHNWFWSKGNFVLHYYGGMQGCWDNPGGCVADFKTKCLEAKADAKKPPSRFRRLLRSFASAARTYLSPSSQPPLYRVLA